MTTDPRPPILLVGGPDEQVEAAHDLGLRVLLLQHPTKITPLQEELADVVRVLDFTDWAAVAPVAQELYDTIGFTVATSQTEPGVENAGRVNDLLGLGGTGYEVAHRFRDKAAMRARLAEVAPDDPTTVPCSPLDLRADLDAFGARHGYPFIVKPVDGTASLAVFRVGSAADADAVWSRVAALRGTRSDRVTTLFLLQDFIMEAYVDGPEFSVEAYSYAGRHVVVAITEKFVGGVGFVELGHATPARVSRAVEDEIRAGIARFLDAMGLREGITHTEIRLTADGPVVIESHNRPAGDAITELIKGAYGLDLERIAFARAFDLIEDLPDRPQSIGGAAVRTLVADTEGTIGAITGLSTLAACAGVLEARVSARQGARVRPLADNWDRLGLVAATGANATSALARTAALIEEHLRIEIVTDDGAVRTAIVAPVERIGDVGEVAV